MTSRSGTRALPGWQLFVPLAIVAACAGVYLFALYCFSQHVVAAASDGNGAAAPKLFIPRNLDGVRSVLIELNRISTVSPLSTLTLFAAVYLFKQSFAIPGSALLNLLAGALYGVFGGLLLVSMLTAVGASIAYVISRFVGKAALERLVPSFQSKLKYLSERLANEQKSGSYLYLLLAMRLFPFTPNWALNIALPHLEVPILYFFAAVLLGLLPYNYICVSSGSLIHSLQSTASIMNVKNVLVLLLLFGVIASVGLHQRRLQKTHP